MSTSGGLPGQVAVPSNTGTAVTGASTGFEGAFGYLNDSTGFSWRPLASFRSIADGSAGQSHLLVAAGIWNGATLDRVRAPAVFKQISALAIGTEATIWTPAAGKKFRLMGWLLAVSAGVTVTLRDNTAGTVIRTIPLLTANVPLASPPEGNGTLSAAANNVLTATGSGAANLTGYVFGTEE